MRISTRSTTKNKSASTNANKIKTQSSASAAVKQRSREYAPNMDDEGTADRTDETGSITRKHQTYLVTLPYSDSQVIIAASRDGPRDTAQADDTQESQRGEESNRLPPGERNTAKRGGRPAGNAQPAGRTTSNSLSASIWSTDAMREMARLVTDEMLDASQVENIRSSATRIDGKENISPAPSVTAPRYLSSNCAPLGSHNGPLRQTRNGVRADTPRPLSFRPPGMANAAGPTTSRGMPALRASPSPAGTTVHSALTGNTRSPPRPQLGKRTIEDRSPQPARSISSATDKAKRAKQGETAERDVFSSEESGAGSRAPSPGRTIASGENGPPSSIDSPAKSYGDPARSRDPSPEGTTHEYSEDEEEEDEDDEGDDDEDADDDDAAPAPQLRSATDHLAAHMIANVVETSQTRPAQGASRSFKFTEVPAEGFPTIDNSSPGWLFANQDHDQLEAWPGLEGEKVVAVIFGHGALDYTLDPSLTSAVGLIEAAIGAYVGSSVAKVSPPIAINAPQALNRAPYGFLVYNLTAVEAKALLRDGCVSTPDISLLLFPLAIQIPRLILSFGGIPSRPEEDVRRMAISCMRSEKHASTLLELVSLTPELTKKHSPRRVLNRIIKSSTITSSVFLTKRAVPMPVYNLLMDIPTTSASIWIRWRDAL